MTTQAYWLRQVRQAMKTQSYGDAIEGLKQAVSLARRDGDRASEGSYLASMAAVYHRTGKPEQALRYFDRALNIARENGDRMTENGLLGNMGNILREIGHYSHAVAYLKQALTIAQEMGDTRGSGIWLSNLGLVYDALHEYDKAAELHAQSVDAARELRDQRGLASRLDNLGNSCISMQDYASALYYYNEAAGIYRELSAWQPLAQRLGIMGNLYSELAKIAEETRDSQVFYSVAVDYYQQAFMVANDLGDRLSQAEFLRNMGSIFMVMGDYEQAIYRLVPASQHFNFLQLRDQFADVQHMLAVAHSQRRKAAPAKQRAVAS